MDEGTSSPIESELAERVGTLINERYRVLRLIGHGSTGAVYACQHVGLDKRVALKVLHREMEQNASFVDRFKLEAQAASRLEHPNSVRVLDFGQDLASGALFIAMEYIEGRDLLQVLEEDGPFTAERAVDVMSQILDVLGVAHAAGIVHRDLKPENVLLRTVEVDGVTREHVTVCDFGIAQFGGRRSAAADGSTTAPSSSPDGEDGLVAGTPAYMSPEQARAEPQDARSDIYSAGVVLYQLLTLQLPFYADDAYALALKHCVEVPPPPSRFGAVSPQLEEICLKALSKSRDARYQSAREMRLALQRALTSLRSLRSKDGSPLPLDGSKGRRWGRPRPMTQGTPSDAPAVEMLPLPMSNMGSMGNTASHLAPGLGRGWRWSLASFAVLGFVVCATALLSHNQDQRASAAAPSARAVSLVRPSRSQGSQYAGSTASHSNGQGHATAAVGGSQRPVAIVPVENADAVVDDDETAYSAASNSVGVRTGGETPEAPVALPAGPLAAASSTAASSSPPGRPGGGAAGAAAADGALAEVESMVSVSDGVGAGAPVSKPRGLAEASRPERRVHEVSSARPGPATAAQDKDKDKDKAKAKEAPAAKQAPAVAVDKIAVAQPAEARPSPPPASDLRPEAHGDSISLGLLPDGPMELAAAAAASAAAAESAAAEPAPKPVLVSRVAHDAEQETTARKPAPPRADSNAAALAGSAQVSISNIASRSGVSKSSVRTALNLSAITDCYRAAIRSGGVSGSRVIGELELATSQSGSVTAASLSAPALPAPLRQCVEQIVRRGRVKEADTGNAQATITLEFLPR